ncbi:MAG: phospholipase D-like domain-containing protein [Polyangiaceae bacterium]
MTPQELEAELEKTLVDQRLSRSEKKALQALVGEIDEAALAKLRSVAFEVARRHVDESKQTRHVLEWLEEVMKLLTAARGEAMPASGAYFSPGDEPLRQILGLLGAARTSIDICVFTITDDRIADAILGAARRGVVVRVITDDDKAFDRGSDIQRLRDGAIPVRVDRSPHHMHHKFAVFDEQRLLTGSYNWTRGAANHNLENVVVTAEPSLVQAFVKTFERLWRELE